MKLIKKYWKAILSVVLIAILSVYVCVFALKNVKKQRILSGDGTGQTIYTIWHVETHEGGGKARIDYLKNIAKSMEKQDPHVLFMIKSIASENLSNELEAHIPNIISFGYGVGKIVLPYLKEFNTSYNIRDELVESASFNEKLYALPFMVGGYALFSHSAEYAEFHCGQNDYINPSVIYSSQNLKPIKIESQYEAYKAFANHKDVKLLGSTRDLFRINNLNNIGRTNAIITPIDSYTDLIQYLGVTKMDETTKKFVELSLNESNQRELIKYSLFSPLYNKLYYDGIYSDMENALYSCKVPNCF